jgi:hypothetical protein
MQDMETEHVKYIFEKRSSDVTHKFNSDDWKQAEKNLSQFDLSVIHTIISHVSSEKVNISNNINVMGQELYLMIRLLIKNYVPEKDIPINKKEDKKQNKKEKIIYENSVRKTNESIKEILKTFKKDEFFPYVGLKCDILEIRAIAFMYSIKFIFDHYDKLKHIKYLPFVLGLLIAIKKFMNACSIIDKSLNISSQCLEDIQIQYDKLHKKFPYDGFMIYDHAPELLIYTDYDNAIPNKEISMRKNQLELIKNIQDHFDTGFILGYIAMIASGKTTMSIGVAQFIANMRIQKENHNNLELLFCCNLVSVKNQVARLCHNASIKFGIAYIHTTGNVKVVNHYSCKKEEDRIVIICSPDAAYKLLTSNYNPEKYILFLDEPTIGADIKNSQSLEENIKLFTCLPKWTILSSATLPDTEKLQPLFEKIKLRYPNMYINQIYSKEIQIGCNLKTYENNLVVPYIGCKNCVDLQSVINKVDKNPFLGRLYTYTVIKTLWMSMNNEKILDLPNISHFFSEIENLSAESVRIETSKLLQLLSQQSNEIIEKICSDFIEKDNKPEKSEKINEIIFESIDSSDDAKIEFTQLGTKQAYRFLNMNLIVTNDPVNFALTSFKSLLDDLNEHGCKSAKQLNNIYQKEITVYKNTIDKFDNNKLVLKKGDKEKDKDEKIANKQEKDKKKQELEETRCPKLKFLDFGQINTQEHLERYASSHIKKIIKRFVRIPNDLENTPEDIYLLDNEIVLLLFCGVGIYCPTSLTLSDIYNTTVLHMASEGKLAYLIADSSICYGTNYPINRVFITQDFVDVHSLNTLFQLLGRAGRVGQSWKAEAYITKNIAVKLMEFVNGTVNNDDELKNILDMYLKIKLDDQLKTQQYINTIRTKVIKQIKETNVVKKLTKEPKLADPIKLSQEWSRRHIGTDLVPKRSSFVAVDILASDPSKVIVKPTNPDIYVPPSMDNDKKEKEKPIEQNTSWRRGH